MSEHICAMIESIRTARGISAMHLSYAVASKGGYAAASDPRVENYIRQLRERVAHADLLLEQWLALHPEC